jgi:hypothetical protein
MISTCSSTPFLSSVSILKLCITLNIKFLYSPSITSLLHTAHHSSGEVLLHRRSALYVGVGSFGRMTYVGYVIEYVRGISSSSCFFYRMVFQDISKVKSLQNFLYKIRLKWR